MHYYVTKSPEPSAHSTGAETTSKRWQPSLFMESCLQDTKHSENRYKVIFHPDLLSSLPMHGL